MKTLLAITTYNQIEYTKKLINCLSKMNLENIDVIFVDDVSKDGTQRFIKESSFTIIERNQPKGLTWSWNIAYRKFKNDGYDCLILSNNDVLFTKESLSNLINATKNHSLVCPLSTKKGAGHNWKNQAIGLHYPNLSKLAQTPKELSTVQAGLKNTTIKMNKFNGFMFAMSRKIIQSEFNKDNLFNPANTNIHQEGDLQRRLKEKPALCLGSFIYHFKGVSFPKKGVVNGKDIRQNLNLYHG